VKCLVVVYRHLLAHGYENIQAGIGRDQPSHAHGKSLVVTADTSLRLPSPQRANFVPSLHKQGVDETTIQVDGDQRVQKDASPASRPRRSARRKELTMALKSTDEPPAAHRGAAPSAEGAVAHAAIAEGRRGPLEGERQPDGPARASTTPRQTPPRMPDRNGIIVTAHNSRDDGADVASMRNVPPDPQTGSPCATIVDDALKELRSSDACLTDDTIRLVQAAICNALGRTRHLPLDVHTVNPLCIENKEFPALPTVPPSARHLIVALRHTTPCSHWTLALIDLKSCRFKWYDPLPLRARANAVYEGLLSWSDRLGRDKAFDFTIVVSI
jgi:hypothetical protein